VLHKQKSYFLKISIADLSKLTHELKILLEKPFLSKAEIDNPHLRYKVNFDKKTIRAI
jgi:hypothetical protein